MHCLLAQPRAGEGVTHHCGLHRYFHRHSSTEIQEHTVLWGQHFNGFLDASSLGSPQHNSSPAFLCPGPRFFPLLTFGSRFYPSWKTSAGPKSQFCTHLCHILPTSLIRPPSLFISISQLRSVCFLFLLPAATAAAGESVRGQERVFPCTL